MHLSENIWRIWFFRNCNFLPQRNYHSGYDKNFDLCQNSELPPPVMTQHMIRRSGPHELADGYPAMTPARLSGAFTVLAGLN
jgi:hypothetical protein